jgi:23S rRNA (uracil1939-C5)-methyltransferase
MGPDARTDGIHARGRTRVEATLTLRIEALAHGGDAVAHTEEGITVFVRYGCPGDLVRAEVTADHGRYGNAVVTEVLEPSADRVTAPCPFFGRCGGCQWQHVSYDVQLAAKRREVSDSLARIGGQSVEVAETVASPREYGYRNRIELRVGTVGRRTEVGYSALGDETLVPVDRCLLLPKRHEKVPGALGGVLRYLGRDPAVRDVMRVGFRTAVHGGDVAVDLWTPPGSFPRQMAGKAVAQAAGASSVTRVLQRDKPHKRDVAGIEVLSGNALWHESLGEVGFGVSPTSFFQVNTRLAETLTSLVLDALQPGAGDEVLDLYAGVGTFTLPLAATGADVTAVEGAGSAVRDLRRNLEENGLWADVAPGDAARALAELGTFDLAVVDPPRSGMRPEALDALIAVDARRLVYVSCDPATLARDARKLAEAGYVLGAVTPIDLFPQTWHVETVAVFDRA